MNCFQILYIRSLNTIDIRKPGIRRRCELLSDFVYSFFEHNSVAAPLILLKVVNCFQILYIRSLNTIKLNNLYKLGPLWIAFRFCIFVLWTQWIEKVVKSNVCCELLSDFVYSFFEHNSLCHRKKQRELWIAFRFCIFVLWTQLSTFPFIKFVRCELLSDFVYSFFEHNW